MRPAVARVVASHDLAAIVDAERESQDGPWGIDRAQFLDVAAQMMRRILVDRARARHVAKRSGRWQRVTLEEGVALGQAREVALLDLERALVELAAVDPWKSQIAELRVFGGLTLEESGHTLRLSIATVEREWQAARAVLGDTDNAMAWLERSVNTGFACWPFFRVDPHLDRLREVPEFIQLVGDLERKYTALKIPGMAVAGEQQADSYL